MGLRKPKIEAGGGVELVEGFVTLSSAVSTITIAELKGKKNFSMILNRTPGNNGQFFASDDAIVLDLECREGAIVYELLTRASSTGGDIRASDSFYVTFDSASGKLTSHTSKYCDFKYGYRFVAW